MTNPSIRAGDLTGVAAANAPQGVATAARADAAEAKVLAGLALADRWDEDGRHTSAAALRAALTPTEGGDRG